jgi:L-ascorbate metabolism protein UlaG (beta-lactamase superfamily)
MLRSRKVYISDELAAKRQEVISTYPERWHDMVRAWQAPRCSDAVWLMYTANYLFNTHNIRWAVDPVLLNNRVPEAVQLDVGYDMAKMDFILLTHSHADHVDPALWSQLYATHCRWVIPDHMLDFISRTTPLAPDDLIVAVPGIEINIARVTITPFSAPHYEQRPDGSLNHVSETGYLVKTRNGTYLLPGDVRTFDTGVLRPFKDSSAVFAHVFLGRSAALLDNPPLLADFVDFYLNCRPRKILLAHLYELGREPEDCWRTSHAEQVAAVIEDADSGIHIRIPEWYEEIIL